MTSLSELRALPHTSISAIKTFVQCPRKYRLHYIDRVDAAFRPIALAIGTVWHEVLGLWLGVSGSDSSTKEELHERLAGGIEAAVNADGPPVLFDDEEQDLPGTIRIATRMLDAFLGAVEPPARVLGVEVPFALALSDPATGEPLSVPLVGAMDAIVIDPEDRRIIWELKTSSKRWSADQLAYDQQSTAYRLSAAELGFGSVGVQLIVVTKTREPLVQVERLTRGPQDEHDLRATAASVLRAIEAGVDHPIRGWACRGCPVAHACR